LTKCRRAKQTKEKNKIYQDEKKERKLERLTNAAAAKTFCAIS
jgi:hypothetical protein